VTLVPWAVAAVAILVAGRLAWSRWARRLPDDGVVPGDGRARLRAAALDALGEAVLITTPDGGVFDCNRSALGLFDREREAIEAQHVTLLRRFEAVDPREPYRVAGERTVWSGEAWARQPDGGMTLCRARVIAIHDARGGIAGYIESYRDVLNDGALGEEVRDLLYGVRAFDPYGSSDDETIRGIRDELRVLGEAFRDLDVVLRQYERLLPPLAGNDPITEVIAGPAHDARSAVASAGVPGLLDRIPRSLARLRAHLQQLAARTSDTDEPARPLGAAGPEPQRGAALRRAMPS
jgi:hypothetical protein